jgi:hypothetical protein
MHFQETVKLVVATIGVPTQNKSTSSREMVLYSMEWYGKLTSYVAENW